MTARVGRRGGKLINRRSSLLGLALHLGARRGLPAPCGLRVSHGPCEGKRTQAVPAGARKSVDTLGENGPGCQELARRSAARQTRVAHRGGRSVRRKRRPTAAVDNPAARYFNDPHGPRGCLMSVPRPMPGGLSGRSLTEPSQRVSRALHAALGPGFLIIGDGGPMSGGDAHAKREPGAGLVHIPPGSSARGRNRARSDARAAWRLTVADFRCA